MMEGKTFVKRITRTTFPPRQKVTFAMGFAPRNPKEFGREGWFRVPRGSRVGERDSR